MYIWNGMGNVKNISDLRIYTQLDMLTEFAKYSRTQQHILNVNYEPSTIKILGTQ